MNPILAILIAVVSLSFLSDARASNTGFIIYAPFKMFPLEGFAERSAKELNAESRTYEGVKAELYHLWGENRGIVVGAAFSNNRLSYFDDRDSRHTEFKMTFHYPSLFAGYYWQRSNVRAIAHAGFGLGRFRAQEYNAFSEPHEQNKVFIAEAEGKLVYFFEVNERVRIPLTLGVSIQRRFIQDFSYADRNFDRGDINTHANFLAGIGIEF